MPMTKVEQFLKTRERVRDIHVLWDEYPVWLIIALPLGAGPEDAERTGLVPIALFDDAEQALAYEAASILPEGERGIVVDGVARTYRPGSLLFGYQRGIPWLDEPEEKRAARMVTACPFVLADVERLPQNPVLAVPGMTVGARADAPRGPALDTDGWRRVIGYVRERRPALADVLEASKLVTFTPDEVVIEVSPTLRVCFDAPAMHLIAQRARDVLHATPEIRIVSARKTLDEQRAGVGIEPVPATWSPSAAIAAAIEDMKALRHAADLPTHAQGYEAIIRTALTNPDRFESPGAAGGLCALVFPFAPRLWALIEQSGKLDESTAGALDVEAGKPVTPEIVRSICTLASVWLPLDVVRAWTQERREAAATWAGGEHAGACDEADGEGERRIRRVPVPDFLEPYYRCSPHLPLGWRSGDPMPPDDLWTCEDAELLKACLVAAFRRARVTPPRIAAEASGYLAVLDKLIAAVEQDPDFAGLPARFALLTLFAADPAQPAMLHLDEADRLVQRLAEIAPVVPRRAFGSGVTEETAQHFVSGTETRIEVAAQTRKALIPHDDNGGIWAGSESPFPSNEDAWTWKLGQLHLDVARGGEGPGSLTMKLDGLIRDRMAAAPATDPLRVARALLGGASAGLPPAPAARS